jgi:hypothetical protein
MRFNKKVIVFCTNFCRSIVFIYSNEDYSVPVAPSVPNPFTMENVTINPTKLSSFSVKEFFGVYLL